MNKRESPFTRSFQAQWADIDANGHLQHTSYSIYATTTRTLYFNSIGAGPQEFQAWKVGPIVLRELSEFKRELKFANCFDVDLMLKAASPDRTRWCFVQHFRQEKRLMCKITLEGAFLDLEKRVMCPPPKVLLDSFDLLPRTQDFVEDMSSRPYLVLKK